MNSPALLILRQYIRLDRKDATAIYVQIIQGIINAIHTKALVTGTKLPGTRTLSNSLYVHRNTVTAAFDDLAAQGWIDIIPQKGAFVASKKIKSTLLQPKELASVAKQTAYTIDNNYVLDSPYQAIKTELYFTDGTADFRLSNPKNLNQFFSAIANKKNTARQLNKDFYSESTNLRNQLQNYLYITKGLAIQTNQILTFQNNQLAFQSIVQTVLKSKDKVIVSQLGHFEMNMKFKQRNVELITIKLDDTGYDMENLVDILQKNNIRALYIQSNHLYPTTMILSEINRRKLLELAFEYKFAIIEDDNSTDFVYSKIPINTLKSLDTNGSVIYINSFKDLLPHPFDNAYVIAPENLIAELSKVKNLGQSNSTYLINETIAEYIKEGLLLRQVQKLTKIYQKRRDNFSLLLDQYLEQNIQFEKPECGLACWIKFNKHLPLLSIAKYCATKNLTIPNYLLYQNQQLTGIRLGFAHLTDSEAEEAIKDLSKAIYEHLYK